MYLLLILTAYTCYNILCIPGVGPGLQRVAVQGVQRRRQVGLGIHYRGVQSEGGAVDGGSIT